MVLTFAASRTRPCRDVTHQDAVAAAVPAEAQREVTSVALLCTYVVANAVLFVLIDHVLSISQQFDRSFALQAS